MIEHADNIAKLLAVLDGLPPARRGAAFVCHLAVADPGGMIRLEVSDRCHGRIIDDERGAYGFGYDPLFLIPEYHRTFGQLGSSAKSVLSHRARAFRGLLQAMDAKQWQWVLAHELARPDGRSL